MITYLKAFGVFVCTFLLVMTMFLLGDWFGSAVALSYVFGVGGSFAYILYERCG